MLKSGKDAAGRAFGKPTANVLMRNLTLEACSCFKHSSGGLHGGLHYYDGCGGLKVGTEMSGGIANVTFQDSHIVYAGAALKMLSPKGRGGFIQNVTWKGITAEESGGLLWLQVSNESTVPVENAVVSAVRVQDVTLDKLSCRFHTAAHPQTDCEAVGVVDLDGHAPAVTVHMENVKVSQGGGSGWSCTGPPMKLTAPPDGVSPPLPASCGSMKSDDAAAAKSKPNVIFVLVDDWGYNDVGYHNAQNENIIRTPNMDRLSSSIHGIRLEKFYSQPICTPTRSQTLTGRMQIHTGLQHGVLWSTQPSGLPLNETTVAEHLGTLGYSTHAIGKWHVGHANLSMTPLRRGFETFFGFWGGSEDHWSHHSGPLDFRDGEAVVRNYSSTNQSNASYSTHLFSRRAVDIVEAHAGDKAPPFFIYLAYQATHAPLQAPPDVIAQFGHVKDASRRTFAAMAAVVDEGIGNITAALIRSGNNNTVLLLSGDNGGQVTSGGSNFPLRGWKGSLWEGGARASAFVWSPLLPPRENFVWRGLSHVSDWLPTALELAGVADPKKQFPALDGFPLWAALTSGGRSPRTELLHEIDRIAEPRFSCGGPDALTDGNGTGGWSLPPVEDRYVRAAIHSIINGTSYKLVIGECAGWDTNSQIVPPPNYAAPPPPPLPAHCKVGSVPNRSTFVRPLIDGTWLFNVDADESERCDLSAAEPELLQEMMSRLKKYAATEVPVRYPDGSPKLDPRRCVPPLDYWFASDEPGLLQRCTGRMPPPPPPPPPPAHPGAPVRFEAANDSCLVAPAAGAQSWLQVGSCAGKHAEWRRIDGPQLESISFPGQCLNVYGGPPACCPGGADGNHTKFHLVKCRLGAPGNAFHSEQFRSESSWNIVLADVSKWRACGNLCVAPSASLVTLQSCSASTTWKRVNVTDANRSLKSDDVGYSSATSPFYSDPMFGGAHDAELVWHNAEQCWWLTYLQNRYNSVPKGSGIANDITTGTDLGLASTPDGAPPPPAGHRTLRPPRIPAAATKEMACRWQDVDLPRSDARIGSSSERQARSAAAGLDYSRARRSDVVEASGHDRERRLSRLLLVLAAARGLGTLEGHTLHVG